MNRNRLGDELGETNKYFFNMLLVDGGCSYRNIFFIGIRELTAFGSLNTAKKYYCVKQLVT
ncbi:MAG: hypothetical protein WD577_02670 [Bacteroidales bacterium]